MNIDLIVGILLIILLIVDIIINIQNKKTTALLKDSVGIIEAVDPSTGPVPFPCAKRGRGRPRKNMCLQSFKDK